MTLAYRAPVENVDLTPRPALVAEGGVTFTVNGHPVAGVSADGGHTFTAGVPLFAHVSVAAGGAHDAAGDTNPTALALG